MRSEEDFIRLYASHERRLRRYVVSLMPRSESVVDDIMQETAVALMRKFAEYDRAQPFFNWACRFAYFEVLAVRRDAARRAESTRQFGDDSLQALARELEASEPRGEDSRRRALEHCLGDLTPAERTLLAHRYDSGQSVATLADQLEKPVQSLYRMLARLREQLAACINGRLATEGAGP